MFWKGETTDVPSGSSNPEGSVAGPGLNDTQDSCARDDAHNANANPVRANQAMRTDGVTHEDVL